VQFSCKISHALINYLEYRGDDIGLLYERSYLPLEVLKDSSRWISAPDMEEFLELVTTLPVVRSEKDLLIEVGHEGPRLHAWGVLDSVLRMMPKPLEILHQPENFLSYFISPKPPVENIRRTEQSINFDIPLPAEQYPLVSKYLRSVLESLPVYVGQPLARCLWENITIQINWDQEQKTLMEDDSSRQMSPALIQDLIVDLQSNQRDLEDERKFRDDLEARIQEQAKTIRFLESKLESVGGGRTGFSALEEPMSRPHQGDGNSESIYQVSQNLSRMHDYMVRAQQLITMLVGEGFMTPQVKKAMHRVDWDFVKKQYPQTVAESMNLLRKVKVDLQAESFKKFNLQQTNSSLSSSSSKETDHV